MAHGLLDHRLGWRYLVARRKHVDLTALAAAVVFLWSAIFGDFTASLSMPSRDLWVYGIIGLCELFDCIVPAYQAWTRSAARPLIVRLWAVLRSLTLLLRLATLVPIVVLIWSFAQTLSPAGFPNSWQEFGLAPGDLGWAPFLYLIFPAYVSRFDILGFDRVSNKDTQLHARQARIQLVWYCAAFVGALIGLNVLLSRLGYPTFWRETNQSCIIIFFVPALWEMLRKAVNRPEDS